MYGRLGGMYFLHLAEASAQRRRLAQSDGEGRVGRRSTAGEDVAMFLRLLVVMGTGFGAIAVLAIMVG